MSKKTNRSDISLLFSVYGSWPVVIPEQRLPGP